MNRRIRRAMRGEPTRGPWPSGSLRNRNPKAAHLHRDHKARALSLLNRNVFGVVGPVLQHCDCCGKRVAASKCAKFAIGGGVSYACPSCSRTADAPLSAFQWGAK